MSVWQLQLPIGSAGDPTTITSSALSGGYTSTYFFTDTKTGALDFFSPETGCVTTPNSAHCRTELQEIIPGSTSEATWTSSGTNVLTATVAVTSVSGSTVVGQIHTDENDTVKPLCELYYESGGTLSLGVEATSAGGDEKLTTVGSVPLGTKFTYRLSFTKGVLALSINGGPEQTFSVGSTFASNFGYYFKAGDYGQGSGSDTVSFYGLNITH
jgi:hypothetical protein